VNKAIIYRPYKTQIWLLTLFIEIFSFVIVGYCLAFSVANTIFLIAWFSVSGIVSAWCTITLYGSSKKVVIFDQNGMWILGSSHDQRYIPWSELTYGCYTRNFKNSEFLVLSPNFLSLKEAKRFANKGANFSRLLIDDVVVIYLDFLQDVTQIKCFVESHIERIDTY